MPRRLIAILLTIYAIAFAFGALTAVRWPSIVMVMGWIVTDDVAGGLGGVNWRELGIAHGAAYLFAALGYYASGATLAARKGGAVGWYVFALAFSIPSVFLVHFDANWWLNPSAGEGAMAGLMAGAVLLLLAVWELRKRPPEFMDVEVTPETMANPAVAAAVASQHAPIRARPEKPAKVKKKHPPLFVPDIVVQRQRAMFIAQARRKKAARAAALARHRGDWDEEEEAA
ncbi:hypothetical protein [Hyphomonas sp.]|uniref:hypothetical protein n=1 Tax=Hyphomonas sp. TaxID=87 RepID=UPI000B2ADEEE|nr:hypothetical protein [Hyphomonas sp.]